MSIPELVPLPFDVDEGFGARARIGLIVLESDQTIEAEARAITHDLPGATIYHSRIAYPGSREERETDRDELRSTATAETG